MSKDYYNILGVSKDATKEEIKKAYKTLAKKCHPDINKEEGAAEKFKEISEAAAVLGDDQKRSQYDQFGNVEGFQQGTGFQGFDFSEFMHEASGFDFDSIFDSLFGGGFSGFARQKRGPKRGANLRYEMEITLEEAAFGAEKSIVIPKLERCEKCKGTGALKSGKTKCSECNGHGVQKRTQRTPFGIFATTTTCRNCQGAGEIIKDPCEICDGSGVVEKNKKITIKIPEGVNDGDQLRVYGEGEAGEQTGPHGDLFIIMHVEPHKIFERQGNDLYLEVPITFTQAALGCEIKIPTLKAETTIKIPSETQTNTIFKLKGKGIKDLHSSRIGDLKARVIIETPTKLNKKQKELLKEFDKTLNKETIFKKIKKAFE